MPIHGSLHLTEQTSGGFLVQAAGGKATQRDLAKFDYLGADELVVIDMLESVLATLRTRYAVLKQQREDEAEAKRIKAEEAAERDRELREARRLARIKAREGTSVTEPIPPGYDPEEEDEDDDEA